MPLCLGAPPAKWGEPPRLVLLSVLASVAAHQVPGCQFTSHVASAGGTKGCTCAGGPDFPTPSSPSVFRHTVNLLGNLPLKCLDVLLTLEPHEGSLEFLGANMDVIRVLLSFLEKRLQQVCRGTCCVGASVALTFPSSCGPCFLRVHTGKWRSAWQKTRLLLPEKYGDLHTHI